jgi:hypothetical protein
MLAILIILILFLSAFIHSSLNHGIHFFYYAPSRRLLEKELLELEAYFYSALVLYF